MVLGLLSLILSACSEKPAPSQTTSPSSQAEKVAPTKADTPNYLPALQAEITQTWQELIDSAQALNEQTKQFTQNPSEGNLEALNTIWEQTHTQYLSTSAYTFLQLPQPPIELDEEGNRPLHKVEIRLEQYPLIPGYLDAVKGYPHSGLIYSEIPITESALENEHQLGDVAYVAMGFHALEFMLEGDPALNLSIKQRFGDNKETANANISIKRRKQYVELLSELILKDLKQLQAAWTTPEGHYFQALRNEQSNAIRYQRIKKFLEREQAIVGELQEKPSDHINADVINLRTERLTKLHKAFGSLNPNEQATP